MTRLLVSVRSIAEASVALHNGADLIDLKEPDRGSLGMSSLQTICAVAREVPAWVPVSAALGEWVEWRERNALPPCPDGLQYLKTGLAGAGRIEGWREEFGLFARRVAAQQSELGTAPRFVGVAYADWQAAAAPRPEEVLDFARASGFGAFLVDTWQKDGRSAIDHLGLDALERLVEAARASGLDIALAGSLRLEELACVSDLRPDIVAVRGAVCYGDDRRGTIDGERVARFHEFLAEIAAPAPA